MTTAVLKPLRKQGDVSKVPAAPTAVLLQGSSAPPTATTPRTQGSSTSPTATLACTQGSSTSLPDTLAYCYTPIVHLDPLLASIKGRASALIGIRLVSREHGLTNRLSLSLASACNPYCKCILPWRRTTRATFPPLCFVLCQPIWVGARSGNFTCRSKDPPGSKRRQLVRQVGACCVLTNNLSLSSRWVVSSNLFSPGRCSVLGVSSSSPSTAATTWYSFSRNAIAATTTVSSPGGGELDDVFPTWRKSSIRVCPAAFLAAGGGGGATVAKQEAAPRRLSSKSTTSAPQRGTCRALTSRLRRRRVSFPSNVPTPSGQMAPAHSRRACWALALYLR
jgi:hypothetical protein